MSSAVTLTDECEIKAVIIGMIGLLPGVVENSEVIELTHERRRTKDRCAAVESFFYLLSLVRHLHDIV